MTPSAFLPTLLQKITSDLLAASGFSKLEPDDMQLVRLAGDGSQRCFYRLAEGQFVLVVPAVGDVHGLAEAKAGFDISRHLAACGVPVPQIYGFDEKTGILLCEDLGDVLLYDLVRQEQSENKPDAGMKEIYKQVISKLVHMQLTGAENFDPAWCWQTERYDRELMIKRESDYFLTSLCNTYCGIKKIDEQVRTECTLIADRAARAPADFFLHRDFQSRNLMIRDNKIKIIDFQGGRLGPLAYDLASLLIDPYTALSPAFREELREFYLDELNARIRYDRKQFAAEYYLQALQRNLQMLGAFAFLFGKQGKPFFKQFITPALIELQAHLAKPEGDDYPALAKLTEQCLKQA